MYTVYKITNTANGKVYIGKTSRSIAVRWHEHIGDARCHRTNSPLHSAIRKYGADKFNFEVLSLCDNAVSLNLAERAAISLFKSNERLFGYNATVGGEGTSGWIPSQKFRDTISSQRTGAGHPLFGKHHSVATREKMKQSHTGMHHYGVKIVLDGLEMTTGEHADRLGLKVKTLRYRLKVGRPLGLKPWQKTH